MWEPFAPFHPFLHTPGFPRLENRDKSIQTGRCFKTCSSQTFRKQRRDISSGISHWIWSQCWNSAVTGALLAFPIPGILTPAPISQRFPVQEGAGHPWEGGSALQEGWKWDWDWDHSGSSQVLPDPPGSASLGLIPGFGGLESCAELVGGGFKLFQQEKFSSINEKENNPCPSPSLLNQCRNLPKSKENWGNQLEICWDFRDGRGSSQIPGLDRHLLTLGPYPGPAAPAAPCSRIPAVPGTGKIRIGKQPGWSWGNFRMQKKKTEQGRISHSHSLSQLTPLSQCTQYQLPRTHSGIFLGYSIPRDPFHARDELGGAPVSPAPSWTWAKIGNSPCRIPEGREIHGTCWENTGIFLKPLLDLDLLIL